MDNFSKRNEYKKPMELEEASVALREKINTYFYSEEFQSDFLLLGDSLTGIEKMMVKLGISYEYPSDMKAKEKNAKKLEAHLIYAEWYEIYDFIEEYINYLEVEVEKQQKAIDDINEILESELSAYRIANKIVVPITNKEELNTIEKAANTEYEPVNKHIKKATKLYSEYDYENSIKDSISAVESMCCILAGEKKATLGEAIDKLDKAGIYIHGAMKDAFKKLYGYTSDEGGIGHGEMDFKNAPSEDAKFMLVACSAFINYLIEKKIKMK